MNPAKTIVSKTGVRKLYKELDAKYKARREICFLLQDWEDSYNVGSMFRLAEAMGVDELLMSGRTPVPGDDPMIPVTSMGQHRRVGFRHLGGNEEASLVLKSEGWSLVAVEIADGASDFYEYNFADKTCLILGNEGGGVYGSVMKHVHGAVYIPMFGKGRSLNVTHAAAVAGYQALIGRPVGGSDLG